ncbi:MAG: hypothetical protein HYT09_04150 [Candidatus Levybacteria bacterium]|nr:hypothetical protein [Candidatus Levybacteria bacterium]
MFHDQNPQVPSAGSSKRKILSILAIVFLLAAIPLTLALVKQEQDIRQEASTPTLSPETVIAKVGENNITKADVDNLVVEMSGAVSTDKTVLNDTLNILIERAILENTAFENNLNPTQEETNNRASAEGISEEEAKLEIIKDLVTKNLLNSRTVVSLGFWSPPETAQKALTTAEVQTAEIQSTDGALALTEIENKMKTDEDILTIADSIMRKYPSLAPILAVNGYILNGLTPEEKTQSATSYLIEHDDSNLDSTTLNGVFSMTVDEVKKISNTETNQGGSVFKLIKKGNETGPGSYSSWLSSQKEDVVAVVNTL